MPDYIDTIVVVNDGSTDDTPNIAQTKGALGEALEGRERGIPWDLTAIEIREVLEILGEIVGETTPEDVLKMIFSRFCIGK